MRWSPGDPVHGATPDDWRAFLTEVIGPDWEAAFILAGATAGPDAENDEVEAGAERAVALARERAPDLTKDGERAIYEAWYALWVDVPIEGGDAASP